MTPLAIKWVASLTLGDALVGAGTLMLAAFTYRLARATYTLDTRAAHRETQQREREVRGVARLAEGELVSVKNSASLAVDNRKWHLFYATPHNAWDRDGAAIVASLPRADAWVLIAFYGLLQQWEQVCASIHAETPEVRTITLDDEDVDTIRRIATGEEEAGRILRRLAYPAAEAIPMASAQGSVDYLWPARWPHPPDVSTIDWMCTRRRRRG